MSYNIETDTPIDFSNNFYTYFDLVELTPYDIKYNINRRQKYFILNKIFDALDLDANNELMLGILSQPERELVVSCAGSGKTTMAQAKIIMIKIMSKIYQALANARGDAYSLIMGVNILFVVYNTHNVEPVISLHKKYCDLINSKKWSFKIGDVTIPIFIDTSLNASTFHSLSRSWYLEYSSDFGTKGFSLVENDVPFVKLMSTASQIICRKHEIDYKKISPEALWQTYVMSKEMLLDLEEYRETDAYIQDICPRAPINLPVAILILIFQAFEKGKNTRKLTCFTDYLSGFYKLLSSSQEISRRISSRFDYYVVDEYQDFNIIMIETLRLLVADKGLFCIGDDDQAIYGFRGVEVENILDFKKHFSNSKVYTLSVNRRCGEEIVNASSFVVNKNSLRFNKLIKPRRNGGVIQWSPYITEEGQAKNIVQRIKHTDASTYNNTVICYKNRAQSAIIGYELFKNKIPFYVSNGVLPFENLVFRDFSRVLQLMSYPFDRDYHRYMSYVTCIGDQDANAIVGYDSYRKVYTSNLKSDIHFKEESYVKFANNTKFQEELSTLVDISNKFSSNLPMDEYMPDLLALYLKNHINWRQPDNPSDIEIISYFTNAIQDYYTSDLTWREFFKLHERNIKSLQENIVNKTGILLSTFHGLKGLEKETVIAISLDDDIYPNLGALDSKDYGEEFKHLLREEEMRLFYVMMTRARDKLYLFYQKDRPSVFVSMLMDSQDEWKNKNTKETFISSQFNEPSPLSNVKNRFSDLFK